jgi:hypothetical protein
MTTRVNALRRPRGCGICRMFGHDRRNCHSHHTYGTHQQRYTWAMNRWRNHCDINATWIAQGGAGIDIPEPQPPKTPFEQACDNTCKVTHTDECCICMEALGEKNKVVTSCGHQFHFGCLIQDTIRSNKCPMCRAIIRPELPKRELRLPGTAAIRRMSVRTADPLVSLLVPLVAGERRDFVADALSQVIAETSLMLLDTVREANA